MPGRGMCPMTGSVPDRPRRGRPTRQRSGFGTVLDRLIDDRAVTATALAEGLGVSPAYVSALMTGSKKASAERVDEIADLLNAEPQERVSLHRAAARDQGFRLDLPDDF